MSLYTFSNITTCDKYRNLIYQPEGSFHGISLHSSLENDTPLMASNWELNLTTPTNAACKSIYF